MRNIALLVMLFVVQSGFAVESTWTGGAGAGNENWTHPSNWSDVAIPVAGNALKFPTGAAIKVHNNGTTADTLYGPITLGSGYLIGGNRITLQGGMIVIGSASASTWNTAVIVPSSVGFWVDPNAVLTMQSVMSGSGGFTKSGSGTLELQAANTLSGPVVVEAGTLSVIDDLSAPVSLVAGTLRGTGTVNSITSANTGVVTLSPGTNGINNIGTLTSGPVALDSTDIFAVSLETSSVDKLVVTGSCIFSNTTWLVQYTDPAYELTQDTYYTVIDNDGTDIVQLLTGNDTNLVYTVALTAPGALANSLVGGTVKAVAPDKANAHNDLYQVTRVGGDGNDVAIRRSAGFSADNTLSASPVNTATQGASVTFTTTIYAPLTATYAADGTTVSFYDGFTKLADVNVAGGFGQASFTTSSLSPGEHIITAIFEGDSTNALLPSQSNQLTYTITGGTATTSTLSAIANSDMQDLSVTVSPTPTGSVTFRQDGVDLITKVLNGSGQATHTTGSLVAGTYTFSVVYPGSGAFGPSSDSTVVVIAGDTTTTSVASSASPSEFGSNVTFTATIAGVGSPTGTVTFYADGAEIGSGAVGGATASLDTAALGPGTHQITATYNGDFNDQPSTSSAISQTVNIPPGGSSGGSGGAGGEESGGGCGVGGGMATFALLFLALGSLSLRRRQRLLSK